MGFKYCKVKIVGQDQKRKKRKKDTFNLYKFFSTYGSLDTVNYIEKKYFFPYKVSMKLFHKSGLF